MRIFISAISLCLFFLAGCVEPVGRDAGGSRILAMGDSLMAWNSNGGAAISDAVERTLGEEVTDRSVVGAYMIYNLPISGSLGFRIGSQYVDGPWDWVILNGGGNDLWLGCGCGACEQRLNKMLTETGEQGEVANIIWRLQKTGAKVVVLGYLRTPGKESPIEHCSAIGDVYEARLERLAARNRDVYFISNRDLVPDGDLSFHAADRIHPSRKGSAAIGARVADLIRRVER